MSRIGKKPVPVGKAKVTLKDRHVQVEGPKGKLELDVHPTITVKMDDAKKEIVVTRPNDEKPSKSLHGLTEGTRNRSWHSPGPNPIQVRERHRNVGNQFHQ